MSPKQVHRTGRSVRQRLLSLLVAASVVLAGAGVVVGAQSDLEIETRVELQAGANRIAVDSTTNTVYVSVSGSVSVVDADTKAVDTVETLDDPRDLELNPETNRLYVANGFGHGLTVIDTTSNSVVTTLDFGTSVPQGVGVNTETNTVYVSTTGGRVIVVDGANNTVVDEIRFGGSPAGVDVAVNSETNRAYVALTPTDVVAVIDGTDNSVVDTVPTGERPFSIAVVPETDRVYVSNAGPLSDASFSVINTTTNTLVDTVLVDGGTATGVAVNPDTDRVYLSDSADRLTVLHEDTHEVLTTLTLNNPQDVAVNPITDKIFVTEGRTSTLAIVGDGNDPPEVDADADSVTVPEGTTATNDGTVSDPDGDAVSLTASAGTVTGPSGGNWSWSLATTDGPDDSRTVNVTATDAEGATSGVAFEVTVENVPPSADAGGPYTVDEGSSVTLTGTGDDPAGAADPLSFAWDLDDDAAFDVAGPSPTLSASDGPATRTVTLRVADDDGGADVDTATVRVRNVAPSLRADADSVTVDEGETATVTGTVSDPGDDAVSLSADRGTVTTDGSGTWTWSFATTDGPDQSGPVAVTATDEDGAASEVTFDLTVRNVAPTANATGDAVDEGEAATVNATFDDPGVDDTHTATVDWGDGTTESVAVNQTTDSLSASHVYGDDGDFTATVTVTDDDGGEGTATATVAVANRPPTASLDASDAVTVDGERFFLGTAGTSQSHSASAEDPGSDDLTFAWSFGVETTHFNDASGPDADPSPGGTFPFAASDAASVTFDEPGVRSVGVTVTDDDGGSAADSLPKLVTGDAGEPRSVGFWRHQYSDRGRAHYSDAELAAFLDLATAASGVFSEQTAADTFGEAHGVLQTRGPGMRDKAEAQALAAWLNFAAGGVGWTEQIDTDGDGDGDRAFHDVMAEVESILEDPDATHGELERAKDLAESVNVDGDDGGGGGGGPGSGPGGSGSGR